MILQHADLLDKNRWFTIAVLMSAMTFAACSGERTIEQVKVRAASDFNCSKEQLAVQELEYRQSYSVRGCNKRANYQYVKEDERVLLNSPIQDDK